MFEAGLVLEGGGMKGVFTAGVLDFFLDKGIEFKNIYGVSAGACTMSSYVSKQRGRALETMTDYLGSKRYMGAYSLLTTGDIFGVDFSYDLVPNYLNPFDYETFKKYEGNAYAVVTNIVTGEAEYIKLKDMETDVEYVRASSSLPLVSRNVEINGNKYLDGGMADSIPIRKSEADGNVKNIVVMTKPVGYRREKEKALAAFKARYIKYPKVYELMKNRHIVYNETVDYIEKQAREKKLILLRPLDDIYIDRLEKDSDKLTALYNEGYKEAENRYEEIMEYLNN
ncbi:MAG: patatin family protein [Lachnospiraceae bacterium]|nr:patatin family protein [Lachnospiraceae bacterium]MCR4932583.1 patatin family protein [Lachnospiraceae bacterium]